MLSCSSGFLGSDHATLFDTPRTKSVSCTMSLYSSICTYVGLQNDGEVLKMLPSYVVKRPTGNEIGIIQLLCILSERVFIGTYLALDLGGTNFRVCKVLLEGIFIQP